MTTFYSVIRYVPDPIADESINIGVAAFEGGKSKFQFINNWKRASIFGKESIVFLKEFAAEFEKKQIDLFSKHKSFSEETFRKEFGRWKNSIQFSELKTSIKPLSELLSQVSKIYLRDIMPTTSHTLNKTDAINLAYSKVSSALIKRYGISAKSLVKKGQKLEGKDEKHEFDLVLMNGIPYFGGIAISFKVHETKALWKEVDAAAYAIQEVKKAQKSLPLALFVIPPVRKRDSFERAVHIFRKLETPIVNQPDIGKWTGDMVSKLPGNILQSVSS